MHSFCPCSVQSKSRVVDQGGGRPSILGNYKQGPRCKSQGGIGIFRCSIIDRWWSTVNLWKKKKTQNLSERRSIYSISDREQILQRSALGFFYSWELPSLALLVQLLTALIHQLAPRGAWTASMIKTTPCSPIKDSLQCQNCGGSDIQDWQPTTTDGASRERISNSPVV